MFKIDSEWPGTLFLSSRPRGGDWLEDEVARWCRSGIDTIVSLLTPAEEGELDLKAEKNETQKSGLTFLSLPIEDRQVPTSETLLFQLLDDVESELQNGRNVLIHCRQGIGRTGLVAASLLVRHGMRVTEALQFLSSLRGVPVPETAEQKEWIVRFAEKQAVVV